MSCGLGHADLWRRAATYVDQIRQGAKPADLPTEQAMTGEFVIHLKTAKGVGLTIPPGLLCAARPDARTPRGVEQIPPRHSVDSLSGPRPGKTPSSSNDQPRGRRGQGVEKEGPVEIIASGGRQGRINRGV
jgi:hypothetical protein